MPLIQGIRFGELYRSILILVLAAVVGWAAPVQAKVASQREVRNLCSELLTSPELVKSVEVRGAKGLRILETELYGIEPDLDSLVHSDTRAFHPHELTSSARYGRMINEARGESLLLVPGIENKNIPGFDGVVLDATGAPIANYSLKTLVSSQSKSGVTSRAWEGVRQAKNFSFAERWFALAEIFIQDRSGQLHINPHKIEPEQLKIVKRWLSKSFRIFGVEASFGQREKRPTRVVVDIQSGRPMPTQDQVEMMRKWVLHSKGLIESISVIRGEEMLVIR